jgi:geranylgeranyl diphosphate synthase, type II
LGVKVNPDGMARQCAPGEFFMESRSRIESAIERAIRLSGSGKAPPRLAEAMRYAVFPGGARVRPRLCLAVAHACGDDAPALTDSALSAIELLHCASLVHDDMPCFDDAALRRGKPSVHSIFGEPLALLCGDALIVLAFEVLAAEAGAFAQRSVGLITTMARAVGMPLGIVAGQAWEEEPLVDLAHYHRAKTGSLFVGAAMAGAIAAGAEPKPWRILGERLGEAYQVADDLRDAMLDEETLGKPAHQDDAHHRPNAVLSLGIDKTLKRLQALVGGAIEAIPDCPGSGELVKLIKSEAKRLVPTELASVAA